MDLFGALPGLLGTVPSIVTAFKGKDTRGQRQAGGQIQQLADAQYNPNNPIYQNLYNANRGAQQQDLAAAISELARQNRKLNTMGRNPLLSAERGGESIFRNVIMGNERAGQQARQTTLDQIRGAQNAQAGNYATQQGLANTGWENDVIKAQAGYGSMADLLRQLFGLPQQRTQLQDGNYIDWNS